MEILSDRFWRIGDFVEEIGQARKEKPPHVNTVDGWFKQLEEKRVHYVNRAGNEKVYDDLDLRIALHIRGRREQKWSLDAIFAELPHSFDLRPFPPQEEHMPPDLDLEAIRRQIFQEVNQAVSKQLEAMKQHYEQQLEEYKRLLPQPQAVEEAVEARLAEFKQLLPRPRDPVEERQERLNDWLTIERVKSKLGEEGLEEWAKLPEGERVRKVGFLGLKKEEDRDKRDQFRKEYIEKHLADRLQRELAAD